MTAELSFIHRYVPGTSDATLLVLHGTGGSEDDLLPLAREVAPAANLLSPRGQVLEDGMPRFFRRLAVGVFDEEDLRARAVDLAEFIAAASREYRFDPARLFAFGYSNGANIAAALLLLQPRSLAGGALLRAMLPIEPPAVPDLTNKPVLLAAGTQDPYSPRERVEALADHLRRAGARVELMWSPRAHGMGPGEIDAVRVWVERHLAPERAGDARS